ncbi:alpha/beta hydrolase family protein [Pseudonocardia spinosispora]|uniref:alpha/beta hydrolase family protein n=1 Tax=Pseudonocardia spinosispora TaxID=103441 RepID=UPI0003F4BEA4|nr:alpha/beta hydrolase [Pseudonocardia spinosispora]
MSRATALFITACALTRTTELATHRLGARFFLPRLFVDRFAVLGGIDPAVFTDQLDGCRSFRDEDWAGHWTSIAETHLAAADEALSRLGGPSVEQLFHGAPGELSAALAPAAEVFADRSPAVLARHLAGSTVERDAATAVDNLVKAITYLFAASWPGWSPARLRAYTRSRRLFEVLLFALAQGVAVEKLAIPVDGGDTVHAYAVFPEGTARVPTVLVSNGLEGTVQEVLLPSLAHRPSGLGLVVMEMPGTYSYTRPLSGESENVYRAVIDHLEAHPRVAADRIGMLGVSFGAYWSTRMAAVDRRLRAVVSNGALLHHSFQASATVGMPEIMLWTLAKTTGARHDLGLGRKLKALSLRGRYSHITVPLLVINGDNDTLVSTQDSIDLADAAPRGELVLYPDDDHCAMGHYTEWRALAMSWLTTHLAP